jgi:hypothetical protein
MAERIAVGDLVRLTNSALNARFPMGMDVDSTTPVRVIAVDKTTGLVRVAPQAFDQPFHENEMVKVASAQVAPASTR